MLQQRGQPGVLVHRALHRQEAAAQLVDQADVHHVAAGEGRAAGSLHGPATPPEEPSQTRHTGPDRQTPHRFAHSLSSNNFLTRDLDDRLFLHVIPLYILVILRLLFQKEEWK